ncbi:MAG: hypothetical protein SOU50_00665 [Oscillospiraceae bacterium]|nr:hypothetical protein [Oscillospiraceae bacterium]MDY2846717.1 hypothetical protein [Oscillospiraceae bacterium]
MKKKLLSVIALASLLFSGCSLSEDTAPQTEVPSDSASAEETPTSAEYSHIEIIQETTVGETSEAADTSSEQTAEPDTEPPETHTEPPEETLPIDEDAISAAYSAIDGSDVIYFGNIYYDSDLNSCGVLFVTADGRAYGGICGYLGNFRSNTCADYLGTVSDITEFGQLSEQKAELLTKYALSSDPEGDITESETDTVLECVSWYECITYDDNGAPTSILAHADEYGYSCSTRDVYIAEIAKNLAEAGIISQWKQFCADNLNN